MTYSIVAWDEESGHLGVAVQTAWFAVGRGVPWAEPGVAAIATQSFAERGHGPRALELLRNGYSPSQALRTLLETDNEAPFRQIAIVGADGGAAAHTGASCVADAGHVVGRGYAAQANMMNGTAVWDAMAEAYEASRAAPFAARLLTTLEAGEGAGGDFRGRQSAALLIVPGDAKADPWARAVDLRIDDHPDPLPELGRLVALDGAYRALSDGLADHAALAAPLRENARIWANALDAATDGDIGRARAFLQPLFDANPRWRDVVRAYGQRGRFPLWQQIVDGRADAHKVDPAAGEVLPTD